MSNICENGVLSKENGVEYVKCNFTGVYCGQIRYCSNDKCIKMLPSYIKCKYRKLKKVDVE